LKLFGAWTPGRYKHEPNKYLTNYTFDESFVKAHVRGLREFDWKGYRCVVTAPEFKGVIATTVNIDPVDPEADDTKGEFISTLELARILADIEDTV
jgi:hypothetical protein